VTTDSSELGDLVRRAQAGDMRAFEVVVERCQDMALACAFGWLGDVTDAADAAQGALIDAYRKLALLRDPAAFPGWLRKLVMTHAERVRRNHREEPVASPRAATVDGPDELLVETERRDQLWVAVGSLPPNERVVIALHHLADSTYAEIADLVGITEEAARMRAHRARRRLRNQIEGTMHQDLKQTWTATRPAPRAFAAETTLFAAIETGDAKTVRRLLDQDPGLVDAEERWDLDTAREVGLQPARHASPLIRAVGRDDAELVQLLLERGADVDRTCGCTGGESALWAATVAGATELVRLLLTQGADPDRAAFAGTTPLHAATIRGHEDIAELLLDAGADATAVDDRGRTAAECARRGPGRARTRGTDDGSPVDVTPGTPIETGIRAIDVFAPLRHGDLVDWSAPVGTGVLVLLIEVLHRLALAEGPTAQIIGFEYAGATQREIEHAVTELAPAAHIDVRLAAATSSPGQGRRAYEAAVSALVTADTRHRPMPVTVVLQHPQRRAEVEASLPDLLQASSMVFLVRIGDEATADTATVVADSTVVLDEARARAQLYPAVDAIRTQGRYVTAAHHRTAEAASELLSRYAAADPHLRMETVTEAWMTAAQQLHRHLAQPFHTTEPFTGLPGEHTALADSLRAIQEIVDGAGQRAS